MSNLGNLLNPLEALKCQLGEVICTPWGTAQQDRNQGLTKRGGGVSLLKELGEHSSTISKQGQGEEC